MMSLFEKLIFEKKDEILFTDVRALHGRKWAADLPAIIALRDRLLILQRWRCAYCQSPIHSDENGHRELDHILPKDASQWNNKIKKRSNDFSDRHHTFGYEQFTFEPKNLIIICKTCNSNKKTFDSRLNRTKAIKVYPNHSKIVWVKPHNKNYSSDIIFNPAKWTYTWNSKGGEYLIRVCKLADIDNLAELQSARAASIIARSSQFVHAVRGLAMEISMNGLSLTQSYNALKQLFPSLNENETVLVLQLQAEITKTMDLDLITHATLALRSLSMKLEASMKSPIK